MKQQGSTLLSILLSALIIGVVSVGAFTYSKSGESVSNLKPQENLDLANDTKRKGHVMLLANALYQFSVENQGKRLDIPTLEKCIGISNECVDLSFLTPEYLPSIPFDPKTGSVEDTGYFVRQTAEGRFITRAVGELTSDITVTR